MTAELLEGSVRYCRRDDGRVEILKAPPTARIGLEFIHSADPGVVRISGARITFGGQVAYRIVGWDPMSHALIAERVDRRKVA